MAQSFAFPVGSRAYRNLKNELLAVVLGVQGVENGRQLLTLELDYIDQSAAAPTCLLIRWSFCELAWACRSSRGKAFPRTVDDGTDDLMDLAIPGSVGAGEPLAQSGGERRLKRLEGALESCGPAACEPQRPGDATVCNCALDLSSEAHCPRRIENGRTS